MPMEVLPEIVERYSCRAYADRPVDEDKLVRVLEAARIAPSASNKQEWRFVVVRDPAMREKLREAANNQPFVAQAPVVLVCCGVDPERRMRCGQPAAAIDVSIAMEHIALQAVREGLGTCWIGSFYPDKVRPLLGIPEDVDIVELMTLGYPADQPRPKSRLSLDDIVCYDTWSF
jgi:nitroreductase